MGSRKDDGNSYVYCLVGARHFIWFIIVDWSINGKTGGVYITPLGLYTRKRFKGRKKWVCHNHVRVECKKWVFVGLGLDRAEK